MYELSKRLRYSYNDTESKYYSEYVATLVLFLSVLYVTFIKKTSVKIETSNETMFLNLNNEFLDNNIHVYVL